MVNPTNPKTQRIDVSALLAAGEYLAAGYDIKAIDPGKHQELCGVDNSLILSNARRLAADGVEVVFRAPIVPGVNDSADDLERLAGFAASLAGQRRLELMPYHSFAEAKYEALGMQYPLADVTALDDLSEHRVLLTALGARLTGCVKP